jgi:excisionase family DNA binding protein
MADTPLDELLTVQQVAEYFRVTPATVRRMSRRGDFQELRVGKRHLRYRRADVEAAVRPVQRERVHG